MSQGFDKKSLASYIASRRNFGFFEGMQRVRIGLTGLAFVFVAVLLAAALTSAPSAEPELTPNSIEQGGSMQNMPSTPTPAPSDPLAELGVAPGKADANSVQPAPAPAER